MQKVQCGEKSLFKGNHPLPPPTTAQILVAMLSPSGVNRGTLTE